MKRRPIFQKISAAEKPIDGTKRRAQQVDSDRLPEDPPKGRKAPLPNEDLSSSQNRRRRKRGDALPADLAKIPKTVDGDFKTNVKNLNHELFDAHKNSDAFEKHEAPKDDNVNVIPDGAPATKRATNRFQAVDSVKKYF